MKTAEQMISELTLGASVKNIVEKYTNGLQKAIKRIPKTKYKCQNCDFMIPVYPGKYPDTCPECNTEIFKGKPRG